MTEVATAASKAVTPIGAAVQAAEASVKSQYTWLLRGLDESTTMCPGCGMHKPCFLVLVCPIHGIVQDIEHVWQQK